MPSQLFEQSLWQSLDPPSKRIVEGSTTPFRDVYEQENATEEDEENLYNLIRIFSEGLCLDTDLYTQIEQFAQSEYVEDWTEDDCNEFASLLITMTERAGFGVAEDESVRQFLSMFHGVPGRPGSSETNVADLSAYRYEPQTGESKKFLRSQTVQRHDDPWGNDAVFQARDVKVYDRKTGRMGYSAAEQGGSNNQKSTGTPLMNPRLNVAVREAFSAVDAVGIGAITHYRVLDNLTGQYLTKQIAKEQAEEIAADLNHEYEQFLAEATPKERQHIVAEAVAGRAPIASTPITEHLLTPLSGDKIAAVQAVLGEPQYTMAGNLNQSSYPDVGASTVAGLKAVALLQENRRKAFGEDENQNDELSSIHQMHRMKR